MNRIAKIKIKYKNSKEYYSKVKEFEKMLEDTTGRKINTMVIGFYNIGELFKGGIDYCINLEEFTPEQLECLQKIKRFEIEYLN